MAEMVHSYDAKAKLLVIIDDITYVNDEEANKFRCSACKDMAIYHYYAICKHVFCGKCHGQYHNKQCPVSNCTNTAITEVVHDENFELGINNLQVHCLNKSNGCEEQVTLFNILEHKTKCKFSTKKILPKLWKPPRASKFDEMIDEQLAKLTTRVDYILGEQIAQFSWKISGFNQIMENWLKGGPHEILSKEFHSIVYGSKVECKLNCSGMPNFDIELQITPYCPNSSPQYSYQRTISILDQSGEEPKRDIRRVKMPRFEETRETIPEGIPIKFLEGNSRYIKDDCIVVNVAIEPLSLLYKSVSPKKGALVWTLENYSQTKREMDERINKWVQSPYMYTSERGYLVHLELSFMPQYITFFLSFDKGEHDDDLGTEFPHTVVVTILNQSDGNNADNSMTEISKNAKTAIFYQIGYLPVKTVELPKYLINDKLQIKLQVI